MPSRGSLPDDVKYEAPTAKKSATVRVYRKVTYFLNDEPADSHTIESNHKTGDKVFKVVEESGVFSSLKRAKFSSELISSSDKNKGFNERLLNDDIKNMETDYFIDVVHEVNDHIGGMSWRGLLYIPAIITVGFLPIWKPETVTVHGIVYGKNGKEIHRESVSDEVNIWSWTPLLLSPAAKAFTKDTEHVEEVIVRASKSVFSKLSKSEMIK